VGTIEAGGDRQTALGGSGAKEVENFLIAGSAGRIVSVRLFNEVVAVVGIDACARRRGFIDSSTEGVVFEGNPCIGKLDFASRRTRHSFAYNARDKECREACEQEKERRFGLLPIQGDVNKLKDGE
jgi:hypothetical protein